MVASVKVSRSSHISRPDLEKSEVIRHTGPLPMSAACERLFSVAGQIFMSRCAHISDEPVTKTEQKVSLMLSFYCP